MNDDLRVAFCRLKPVCDLVMVCPTADTIAVFMTRISEMKQKTIQDLQQYLMFPFTTHLKSVEMENKYELQQKMTDIIRYVLEQVTVNSFEMCMKVETALLGIVFDNSKAGMIAEVPEELKLSVMQCLTLLMLNLERPHRETFLKTQVPMLAQAVFVSVHLAKLEKLRALRLAALHCLTAHTVTHPQLTDADCHIPDPALELLAVNTLCSILPGVLAALQDVATCKDNPGHAVVLTALNATHRILCLVMQDKYAPTKEVSAADFALAIRERTNANNSDVSGNGKNPKLMPTRCPEWYAMAGAKLTLVSASLAALRTHEHYTVRRELAVYCYRLLTECNDTMQPSVPLALDLLVSLARDPYPHVAQYCAGAVHAYFANAAPARRQRAMDGLCQNFLATLNTLPRILNNIDSNRKLSALNLVHGYVQLLCDECRPQRLTSALSTHHNMHACCHALLEAAAVAPVTSLRQYAPRDVSTPPPATSPWCRLRHLDLEESRLLQDICQLLGAAECAELVVDRLLEVFRRERACESVYIMNQMGAAHNSPESLVRRILDTYIEEDVWYSPLDVSSGEAAPTASETLDVTVYNPRAWIKDSVPDLYEGATETRYTDVSYLTPRVARDPHRSLAEAQRNMARCCLLAEGVGALATRLGQGFHPYLLKTLCLVLERVGSKYEMLHLAGLKALNCIATACGHDSVAALIRANADYFTHQVTVRLKKAWDSQSALQILSVVMEYSDCSILDCLYGIVEDVLVQSLDKYHERDLQSYLQVFLTFIECIDKWFSGELLDKLTEPVDSPEIDVLKDVLDLASYVDDADRLMSFEEFEKECEKSVEEMYREDLEKRDDDELDYDDRVTEEAVPLSQHVAVTATILKRCIHFIPAKQRDESILALQVLTRGLPILSLYEDELLPLVHLSWAPLVTRFHSADAVVRRRAIDLLVTMATLAKDFIRSRAVQEVLPQIYHHLLQSAADSRLKDAGCAYRLSHAYSLQVAALTALPSLCQHLALEDTSLEDAMACVDLYLSKKQPKPLQALAVTFFKGMLTHDYGAAWHHLRTLCDNASLLTPPTTCINLQPVVGTPYEPADKDYESNINLIFDIVV